ncbi:uncharacterized protein N7482_009718 [Penicillium canariense]|uniref:Uncharacterized protein n=1 Tax=Penicillium canariense TaxID=189055 RepID=A0A9W9HR07_9EURO|nr:uncharacterized protein N7482_009718 [Penicillium canariense]KAJ5153240.1 hypothetical protein N7482_009718 [Penicillium canariense]
MELELQLELERDETEIEILNTRGIQEHPSGIWNGVGIGRNGAVTLPPLAHRPGLASFQKHPHGATQAPPPPQTRWWDDPLAILDPPFLAILPHPEKTRYAMPPRVEIIDDSFPRLVPFGSSQFLRKSAALAATTHEFLYRYNSIILPHHTMSSSKSSSDLRHIGAGLKAPHISGHDYNLSLPNDKPSYASLLPKNKPAKGSAAVSAWLAAPKESQPWVPLGLK